MVTVFQISVSVAAGEMMSQTVLGLAARRGQARANIPSIVIA